MFTFSSEVKKLVFSILVFKVSTKMYFTAPYCYNEGKHLDKEEGVMHSEEMERTSNSHVRVVVNGHI